MEEKMEVFKSHFKSSKKEISMREKIGVYVGIGEDLSRITKVQLINIPKDIDEVELKGRLRDMGFISAQMKSYQTTKVFLFDEKENTKTEICTNESRSLDEIGVKEKSLILIKPGIPEERIIERRIERSWSNMKCLYGCPMSSKVEEQICEAENYKLTDSETEEVYIGE